MSQLLLPVSSENKATVQTDLCSEKWLREERDNNIHRAYPPTHSTSMLSCAGLPVCVPRRPLGWPVAWFDVLLFIIIMMLFESRDIHIARMGSEGGFVHWANVRKQMIQEEEEDSPSHEIL